MFIVFYRFIGWLVVWFWYYVYGVIVLVCVVKYVYYFYVDNVI